MTLIDALIRVVRLFGSMGKPAEQSEFSSKDYWEQRYRAGGNSGAGSYNQLAENKAQFLNGIVKEYKIRSVIELGCGDGAQLSLARYPVYIGVDVSPTAVASCRSRFVGDQSKEFVLFEDLGDRIKSDMSISLDVIYHLVEDHVFESYMNRLFDIAEKMVIIYSSDFDASWPANHVRHRKFSDWISANRQEWHCIRDERNPFPYDEDRPQQTSFADFHVFARKERLVQ